MIILFNFFLLTSNVFADENTDQWKQSEKTYKNLIDEGFEIKGYETATINIKSNLILILFITVLQKEKQVFECQEYQTLDKDMKTLEMSLTCRELVQPFQRGIGT